MNPDFNDPTTALYDEFLRRLQLPFSRAVEQYIEAALPATEGKSLAQLKVWLDGFRPLAPAIVAELRQFYTVSLTYNSNAIEGNTLTQSETEMVISRGITVGGKTLVEHLEVIGHRDAMAYMEELALSQTLLTEREIKDLHALITRPAENGRGPHQAGIYRSLDVRAAGTGHVYPPHYEVAELMEYFVQWLHSDEAERLDAVEYASEAHFRFVSIHPFRDGNGRTARLLMNLCLLRAGYPIAVISNARRAAYIEALIYGQTRGNDARRLTALVAQACRESLVETLRLLATAGDNRGRNAEFYRALLAAG